MRTETELIYFPAWTAGRQGYAARISEVLQEHLKSKGQRFTDQRMAILDHLLKTDRHLSQDDIYQALKGRGIGKVTVFRTLKMLEECELVDPVADAHGEVHYEVNRERPHHDHLVCVDCNRISEIQWPLIEKTQEKICRQQGFEILYHRHEIFGRCQSCRDRKKG